MVPINRHHFAINILVWVMRIKYFCNVINAAKLTTREFYSNPVISYDHITCLKICLYDNSLFGARTRALIMRNV